MPKTIYTERDIDELFEKGIRALNVSGAVVLTDLAYERASRLGIQLDEGPSEIPPSAPVRPYLSQAAVNPPAIFSSHAMKAQGRGDLRTRLHDAVRARLGNQIEPKLLDSIIERVLKTTGLN